MKALKIVNLKRQLRLALQNTETLLDMFTADLTIAESSSRDLNSTYSSIVDAVQSLRDVVEGVGRLENTALEPLAEIQAGVDPHRYVPDQFDIDTHDEHEQSVLETNELYDDCEICWTPEFAVVRLQYAIDHR